MHHPEDNGEFLNSHNEKTPLDDVFGPRKQIFREEVKEPEPDPKDRTATILKFTAWTYSSWFKRVESSTNQTRNH
jgi:hypothetical protein